ncbi:Cytochrome P450 4V2 [Strongyloides ratti]|uniref:Cytochrome P450 4V2 n=1 Tax=Strongyloides ratti TaxID=34506 RepID=A0A090LNP6_STRRB|nr:Cytochrome P450 4V2 [Strongyloides ratti]CEF71381.1 Cytochrome P450 4V2 [Strongyloides ratti]
MELKNWILIFLITFIALNIKNIYFFLKQRYTFIVSLWNIPGPLAIPIFGSTLWLKWNIEDLTLQINEFSEKLYQQNTKIACFWLGPYPLISPLHPETAEKILSSTEILRKGPEYSIFTQWLKTGLLTSWGNKWKSRRRLLTPTFHFNILKEFMNVFNNESKILIKELSKSYKKDIEFDVFPYMKRCALDIICDTSMGRKVNAQINHNHPYVLAVQNLNVLSFKYLRMPWLWIKPIWYLSGMGYLYNDSLKLVTDFSKQIINEKINETLEKKDLENNINENLDEFDNDKKKKAFLDLLIEKAEEGNLSYEDICEEVDTFMFEGHDTTSASLSWTIWCLAHYPEYQEKLHKEIDEIFNNTNRDITFNDLSQLKYLEMCIKESLRIFPSVPLFSRIVENNFTLDKYIIPKGSTIVISPLLIHRNPNVFKNSTIYNPDNFLPENINQKNSYSFIPFSAGPRNCIGQKFALYEEKVVLAWFFRNFTVTSNKSFDFTLPCPEIILKPSKGIPVCLKKRF